ncbi:M23 family metallopeptidase [Halobacteriovorax sp. GFR7]|uniref:M23 family metallopeptidase n=1 Tax=unclassified Halobacteriovorax TaxID=2639665 RepID=UPI003D97A98C
MRQHTKLLPLFFILFIYSCAGIKPLPQLGTYEVEQRIAYPGKVNKIVLELPSIGEKFRVLCGKETLGHNVKGNTLETVWAPKYWYFETKDGEETNAATSVHCYLKSEVYGQEVQYHIATFEIKPFDYKKSYIKVSKKHVDLSPEAVKRWQEEVKLQKEAYATAELEKSLTDKDFIKPLDSKITAYYGNRRVFNNKKNSWHSGTDMRARRPTPVKASNDGRVILVKDLFFNGNAVFIDHGAGVITMYCHLSKFKVNQGDTVKRGQIIALSGNTGRSSAPHLHWGVRVQGKWVDGLQFIKEKERTLKAQKYVTPKIEGKN